MPYCDLDIYWARAEMPQLGEDCSVFTVSRWSVLHKALPINMTGDGKRQMGTFQSPVTYYLCYLCSEINNIHFIDERAVRMPLGLLHIAKLQVI